MRRQSKSPTTLAAGGDIAAVLVWSVTSCKGLAVALAAAYLHRRLCLENPLQPEPLA